MSTRAVLLSYMERIKPSIPFDLEPQFNEPPSPSIRENDRRRELSERYEEVRDWHRIRDLILNMGVQFQRRVSSWMVECFGLDITRDVAERNHRFLEEALELVQAKGCTAAEAHMLVDYVFGRPVGDPLQEVGGVMVTLAALCYAADLDMDDCAEAELRRCWTNIERIRAKQKTKPRSSPLPGKP